MMTMIMNRFRLPAHMRGRQPNAKFGTSLLEHLEAREDGPFEIEWEAMKHMLAAIELEE